MSIKAVLGPFVLPMAGDAWVFRVDFDLTPLTEVYLDTWKIVTVVQWLVLLPTQPPP